MLNTAKEKKIIKYIKRAKATNLKKHKGRALKETKLQPGPLFIRTFCIYV